MLESAQTSYEHGNFEEAIATVKSCNSEGSSHTKWRVHRILALSYIQLDEYESAKSSAIELLKLNPTYEPDLLKDPSEFVRLINSVLVIPKFTLGIAFSTGLNYTMPSVSSIHTVTDQDKSYTGVNKFEIGFSGGYQFSRNFGIKTRLEITSKAYELDHSFGNWELSVSERLNYVRVPIELQYLPMVRSALRPYANCGVYGGFLLKSENDFDARFIPDDDAFSLSDVNSSSRRHQKGVLQKLFPIRYSRLHQTSQESSRARDHLFLLIGIVLCRQQVLPRLESKWHQRSHRSTHLRHE